MSGERQPEPNPISKRGERSTTIILSDRDWRIIDGLAARDDKIFKDTLVEAFRIGVFFVKELSDGSTLHLDKNDGYGPRKLVPDDSLARFSPRLRKTRP